MLAHALPVLPRAPPQPLPSLVLAVGFLQVQSRLFEQLEVDADAMAPYMALPAACIRPSPLSFSFTPSTVYGIFVSYLQLTFIILFVLIPIAF